MVEETEKLEKTQCKVGSMNVNGLTDKQKRMELLVQGFEMSGIIRNTFGW